MCEGPRVQFLIEAPYAGRMLLQLLVQPQRPRGPLLHLLVEFIEFSVEAQGPLSSFFQLLVEYGEFPVEAQGPPSSFFEFTVEFLDPLSGRLHLPVEALRPLSSLCNQAGLLVGSILRLF